ncbi:DUF6192 family protein [Streptomyces sp. NPDC055239]
MRVPLGLDQHFRLGHELGVDHHIVNEAQFDRFQRSLDNVRNITPELDRTEHSAEFVDLVAVCAQFVAAAGRIVPGLRGRHYRHSERETGEVGLAEETAALLRGGEQAVGRVCLPTFTPTPCWPRCWRYARRACGSGS